MMKRALSTGERALLVFLGILVICVAYYFLVHRSVEDSLSDINAQKENAQLGIKLADAKLQKMQNMQYELDTINVNKVNTSVPEYDNLAKEIVFLNTVLAGTSDYTINFASVNSTEGIVRRVTNISFTSSSYNASCTIIRLLQDCKYCCRIGDVTMDPIRVYDSGTSTYYDYNYDADYSILRNPLTVNVSMTFYERVTE